MARGLQEIQLIGQFATVPAVRLTSATFNAVWKRYKRETKKTALALKPGKSAHWPPQAGKLYTYISILASVFSLRRDRGPARASLWELFLTELSDWPLVGLCGVFGTLCAPLPPSQLDTQPVTPCRPSSSSIYGSNSKTVALKCFRRGNGASK